MNKYHKFPLIAGALYLSALIISVASAWVSGRHLFDLGISFSAYVGLQRWTSVMYFVFASAIVALMTIFVSKAEISPAKKIIYYIIFVCIFGTAFFPFNTFSDHPTALTVDIHNFIAIILMLATTVSFIISAVSSRSGKLRITAIISLVYAAVFIALYFMGIPVMLGTFFIWENVFILLLLLEVYMERYEENAKETSEN